MFDFTEKPYELFQSDCLEVMKSFPDNCIDLTVTSPPYDNLRNYQGYSFNFESVAQELFRITKKGGVVVWVVGDQTIDGSETGTSFRQALYFKEIGFRLHDTMIYASEKLTLNHNRYEQKFEYMFVFSKGKPTTANILTETTRNAGQLKKYNYNPFNITASAFEANSAQRFRDESRCIKTEKQRGNIWYYEIGYNCSSKDDFAFQHPAVFPESLASDHIISWSNKGDVVLDCFMGSGTTGKMSLVNQRKFVGIEISADYMHIAEARIKRANLEPCEIPKATKNLKPTPLFDDID